MSNEKLQDIFSKNLTYYIGKVSEAILNTEYFSQGEMHLGLVEEALDAFKQALINRGEWNRGETARETFDEMEYPLQELRKFFQARQDAYLHEKAANIFWFFVTQRIELLRQIADEIDAEAN